MTGKRRQRKKTFGLKKDAQAALTSWQKVGSVPTFIARADGGIRTHMGPGPAGF